MVWVEVEESVKLWEGIEIGTQIEGMIQEKKEGKYGNQWIIALKEGGKKILTPSHKNLQDKLDQLKVTDVVRITYKEAKPTKHSNDIEIYKVEVDKPKK